MDKIKVTHIGEDYGTVEIENAEYECSRGLAEALKRALKPCAHQYIVGRGAPSREKRCVKCGQVTKDNCNI